MMLFLMGVVVVMVTIGSILLKEKLLIMIA